MNKKLLIGIGIAAILVILAALLGKYIGYDIGYERAVRNLLDQNDQNWKVYKNQSYGFKVKYPNNFTFVEKENRGPDVVLLYEFRVRDPQKNDYFYLETWKKEASLFEFVQDQAGGSEVDPPLRVAPKTLNGITGFEAYGSTQEGHGYTYDFYFEKANLIWVLHLDPVIEKQISPSDSRYPEGYQEIDRVLYKQILSSFKLLD